MSWTVNVVPISAPRITPMVCENGMRPAETKPISITVVAEEDWMIPVTAAPERSAVNRFRVRWVKR
jgi:hypothetical protein